MTPPSLDPKSSMPGFPALLRRFRERAASFRKLARARRADGAPTPAGRELLTSVATSRLEEFAAACLRVPS